MGECREKDTGVCKSGGAGVNKTILRAEMIISHWRNTSSCGWGRRCWLRVHTASRLPAPQHYMYDVYRLLCIPTGLLVAISCAFTACNRTRHLIGCTACKPRLLHVASWKSNIIGLGCLLIRRSWLTATEVLSVNCNCNRNLKPNQVNQ